MGGLGQLQNNHRAATEELLAHLAATQPDGPAGQVVVGVDECVAQEPVAEALNRLLGTNGIGMVFPLWSELRQRADGEVFCATGAPGSGVIDGINWSHRVPGRGYADDDVVAVALSYLYSNRVVVLLTANRRGDPGGLRQLLHHEVAPVLNRNTAHGRSLIVLMQRPRTTIDGYATRVSKLLHEFAPEPGFTEMVV